MPDPEITTTILRQIRDAIGKSNNRLDALAEQSAITNERLSMLDSGFAELGAQLRIAIRYIKTKHDPVITDLLKRVARLEKKVS